MRRCLPILLLVTVAVLCCERHVVIPNDPLPALNATVSSGGTATDAAKESVSAALPHADPTGQTILGKVTIPLLDRIKGLWSSTSAQLESERRQKQAIADDLASTQKTLESVKAGWGWRLQDRVHRCWVWIKWILGLGFVAIIILRILSDRLAGAVGWGAWLALKAIYAFCTAGISLVLDAGHFLGDRLVDWISSWFGKGDKCSS